MPVRSRSRPRTRQPLKVESEELKAQKRKAVQVKDEKLRIMHKVQSGTMSVEDGLRALREFENRWQKPIAETPEVPAKLKPPLVALEPVADTAGDTDVADLPLEVKGGTIGARTGHVTKEHAPAPLTPATEGTTDKSQGDTREEAAQARHDRKRSLLKKPKVQRL